MINPFPGKYNLSNFRHHLEGAKHRAALKMTNTNMSAPKKKPNKTTNHNASKPDVVDAFLKEIGLSSDLADVLKRVGIIDERRIIALGKLSDAVLDRLESGLAEAGLDVAARLLVREGLKTRAAAADTVVA